MTEGEEKFKLFLDLVEQGKKRAKRFRQKFMQYATRDLSKKLIGSDWKEQGQAIQKQYGWPTTEDQKSEKMAYIPIRIAKPRDFYTSNANMYVGPSHLARSYKKLVRLRRSIKRRREKRCWHKKNAKRW